MVCFLKKFVRVSVLAKVENKNKVLFFSDKKKKTIIPDVDYNLMSFGCLLLNPEKREKLL